MNIVDALIQGIIQGLSEFLPISSSGHLSLYQHFFISADDDGSKIFFTILLHAGTLVAIFAAFRDLILKLIFETGYIFKDIFTGNFTFKKMTAERNMIFMLIISLSLLAPFMIFKNMFKSVAGDNDIVIEGICFLYTAMLLYLADKSVNGKKTPDKINYKNAVTVGIFQGIALLPGVSRSGSTISSGIFCGFSKKTAVQYSFILGIPTILGGIITEIPKMTEATQTIGIPEMITGFVTAAVVGFMAIKIVSWLIKNNRFKIFYIYTGILGIVIIGIGIYENITGHAFL